MDSTKAILGTIRTTLISSAAVTAYVSSANIKRADTQAKPSYPHISIRVEGGNAQDFTTAISGDIYVTIYALTTNAPSGRIGDYLDDIYAVVKAIIHNKSNILSDSNIRIDKIYESFKGSAIPEDDIPNLYYISARYNYMAHTK
jgi:hypothetical protein